MTRKKTADTADTADLVLEQPATGGSYIRQEDGSLLRVEHPPVETAVEAGDDADVQGDGPVTDTNQEQ